MSRGRVMAAAGIYGTFAAVAWAGAAAVGRSPWHLEATLGGSRWVSVPAATALGVAVGAASVALSRVLVRRSSWGRALHHELRLGVAGLSPRSVAPLTLASAIGEEMFFRGGLQAGLVSVWGAVTGVALTAVLFGLAHIPWNRRLLSWTATAAVMGLVFGALYQLTGELLAPIAAHAVINHENLRFMLAETEQPEQPAAFRRIASSRL